MTQEQTASSAPPRVEWTTRELGRYAPDEHATRTLVVVAGMHGNEPAGLLAAKRVLETLDREQPTGFHGRLIVLCGNLAALNHHDPQMRYIEHDLNRIFTDEQIALPASTSPEHAQMQELLASLRAIRAQSESMVLVDLHTTSADAPPVVVHEDAIVTRRLARSMPLPIYLGFEEELDGLLIDRVSNEMGAPAMVIEGGQHEDPGSIDAHEAVIWAMLDSTGLLACDAIEHERDPMALLCEHAGASRRRVFDIRYRFEIRSSDFSILPGVLPGMPVRAEQTPIAQEHGSAIASPVRGMVFMPNMQKIKRPGDDGFFVVRRVGEGWLGLSARLRRQHWLHGLIAHMPGVYPLDGQALFVDADLAAVLRRQVLHLLGYRLVRHDQRDGGHGLMRLVHGSRLFLRALIRGPIKGGIDPGDPRFWIVRRHRLDTDRSDGN